MFMSQKCFNPLQSPCYIFNFYFDVIADSCRVAKAVESYVSFPHLPPGQHPRYSLKRRKLTMVLTRPQTPFRFHQFFLIILFFFFSSLTFILSHFRLGGRACTLNHKGPIASLIPHMLFPTGHWVSSAVVEADSDLELSQGTQPPEAWPSHIWTCTFS